MLACLYARVCLRVKSNKKKKINNIPLLYIFISVMEIINLKDLFYFSIKKYFTLTYDCCSG